MYAAKCHEEVHGQKWLQWGLPWGVMTAGTLQASSSHILWHILWGVKDSVHGVDFGKFQHAAIAQLAVGIEFSSPQAGFKDAEGRDLHKAEGLVHMSFKANTSLVEKRPGALTHTPREISAPASASAFAIAQPKPCMVTASLSTHYSCMRCHHVPRS